MELDRQAIVDYLNKCYKAEPEVIQAICSQGVPVTNLSDENPITVESDLNGGMQTSGLGLLNGMIEYLEGKPHPIYCVVDEDSKITHFEV